MVTLVTAGSTHNPPTHTSLPLSQLKKPLEVVRFSKDNGGGEFRRELKEQNQVEQNDLALAQGQCYPGEKRELPGLLIFRIGTLFHLPEQLE